MNKINAILDRDLNEVPQGWGPYRIIVSYIQDGESKDDLYTCHAERAREAWKLAKAMIEFKNGSVTIEPIKDEVSPTILIQGDYVVATKWSDGDPNDHFCIGSFKSMTWHNRYNIVDDHGELFRHNGFRKVRKINEEVGAELVAHINEIQKSNISVWDWVDKFENE